MLLSTSLFDVSFFVLWEIVLLFGNVFNDTLDNDIGPHTSNPRFDGINMKIYLLCYLYFQNIFPTLVGSLSSNLARILQSSICWNVLQNSFSDGSNDLQSRIKWTASALAMIYTWALPHWAFQMQFTFSLSQSKFNPAYVFDVFDVRIKKNLSKITSPYIFDFRMKRKNNIKLQSPYIFDGWIICKRKKAI